MFIIQKIISSFIISPGMFIILLLLALYFSYKNKTLKWARIIIIGVMILIYTFSTEVFKNKFIEPLELTYPNITMEQLELGDSYVILGGGINEESPQNVSENTGAPYPNALYRVVEGVRLYKISPKKIIISGGIVYSGKKSEGSVYKQLMVDLGVPSEDIIVEGKSKTTEENAMFTRKILEEKNFKRPILITSATHMKRSVYVFEKNGVDVIPAPTGYKAVYKTKYYVDSYLPDAANMSDTMATIWEYVGILFYKLKS